MTPCLALADFGVDTNVFNSAEAKRDLTFTLAPHVDVWVPFKRRALLTTSVTTELHLCQRALGESGRDWRGNLRETRGLLRA